MSEVEKPKKKAGRPKGDTEPITFNLSPRKRKPKRKYKKGSKYDPLLDAFMKGEDNLVQIEVPNVLPNYLRTQLAKRIATRNLPIKASVIEGVCYLEKEVS